MATMYKLLILAITLHVSLQAMELELNNTKLNEPKRRLTTVIPLNNEKTILYATPSLNETVKVIFINENKGRLYCQTALGRDIKRCCSIPGKKKKLESRQEFYDLFKMSNGSYEVVYLSLNEKFFGECDIVDFERYRGAAVFTAQPDDVGEVIITCQETGQFKIDARLKKLKQSKRANSSNSSAASNV